MSLTDSLDFYWKNHQFNHWQNNNNIVFDFSKKNSRQIAIISHSTQQSSMTTGYLNLRHLVVVFILTGAEVFFQVYLRILLW